MTDEDVTARLTEALEAEEARPQREADPRAVIETQNWDRYARAAGSAAVRGPAGSRGQGGGVVTRGQLGWAIGRPAVP
jgi:hypothetical protein